MTWVWKMLDTFKVSMIDGQSCNSLYQIRSKLGAIGGIKSNWKTHDCDNVFSKKMSVDTE